jgi:hypothetical protein
MNLALMVKNTRAATSILLLIFVVLATVACTESGPPELVQAAGAIDDMLKPANLSRSMYSVAFPDGKPSNYVSYMFSEMGAAEWPPSEAWADELVREQMEAIGQTLLPADVAIVPLTVDPSLGKQMVISFDDERGMVMAHGYLDPAGEPTLTREWKLPRVEPAPGVELFYRANLDEGLSAQSFKTP